MKRILLSVFVGIGAVLCACSADKGDAGNVIPFADPFIYYEDGTYYLYGTGSEDGIAVATSKDLKTWTWPEEGFSSPVIRRIMVDLPEPDGPTKKTKSPSSIFMDTPFRAVFPTE